MSAEHTSRFLTPFLQWLCPTISPLTLARIEALVRKAGHVGEYALLAALLFRALVCTLLAGRIALVSVLVLSLCALYAASDEFHQSFVPSRTASARDVLIDLCGATLAIALYACWLRLVVKRSPPLESGPERI